MRPTQSPKGKGHSNTDSLTGLRGSLLSVLNTFESFIYTLTFRVRNHLTFKKILLFDKNLRVGVEEIVYWLRALLFQKPQVWFPAPM